MNNPEAGARWGRRVSSVKGAGRTGWPAQCHTMYKKWIKRSQRPECLRPKTTQLVEESISSSMSILAKLGLGLPPLGYKSKNKQMGLQQTKTLLHKKKTINKMKSPLTEWEKCLQMIHVLKGLLHKRYKELTQLSIKKKKTKIIQLKMGRGPEQTLL